jgi:hypothetical protein
MARLPAALCYLDVPSMTMMDPASPVRIVPAWSRLPNKTITIARRWCFSFSERKGVHPQNFCSSK